MWMETEERRNTPRSHGGSLLPYISLNEGLKNLRSTVGLGKHTEMACSAPPYCAFFHSLAAGCPQLAETYTALHPRFNTLDLPNFFSLQSLKHFPQCRSVLADLSHLPVARLFLVIYSGVLQSSQWSAEPMLKNIDLQGWKPGGLLPAKSCVLCRQKRGSTITPRS